MHYVKLAGSLTLNQSPETSLVLVYDVRIFFCFRKESEFEVGEFARDWFLIFVSGLMFPESSVCFWVCWPYFSSLFLDLSFYSRETEAGPINLLNSLSYLGLWVWNNSDQRSLSFCLELNESYFSWMKRVSFRKDFFDFLEF